MSGTFQLVSPRLVSPVPGTNKRPTGANLSHAVAAAPVTQAAFRTFAARAADRINFADYAGADPTGTTDMSNLIDAALADARAQGKALYFPAGVWGYAAPATVQQGDRIFGDGPHTQFMYVGTTTSAGTQTLFQATTNGTIAVPDDARPTVFADFRVTGPWNGTTVIANNGTQGELILVQGLALVYFHRLVIEYSVNQGIQASFCRHVVCDGCTFQYIARDGFNASGSSFVRVSGNQFRHIDDNCISGHANWNQGWGIVSDWLVEGNDAADTAGISCQGLKRGAITGNKLSRMKGIGIEVAYAGATEAEGNTPPVALRIANNVITDVINLYGAGGSDDEGHYIVLGNVPSQQGNATAIPGLNTTIVATMSWATSSPVASGLEIVDPNGNIQRVAAKGTTGSPQPSWNTTTGGTTTDGSVTWTNQGNGIVGQLYPTSGRAWQARTTYAIGNVLVDGNGNLQQMTATSVASPATYGESGTSTPGWATPYNATTPDNQITWTCLGANANSAPCMPYAYMNSMRQGAGDTTTPLGVGLAIEICGNICMRTIDATLGQPCSALGFGLVFGRNGWYDPTLGSQELVAGVNGVDIISNNSQPTVLSDLRISGNVFVGLANGVHVGAGVRLLGCEIVYNRMSDLLNNGVALTQANASHRMLIGWNTIDGDPWSARRGGAVNGRWPSGLTYPAAFTPNQANGVDVVGNRLRNLYQITNGSWGGNSLLRENMCFCNPAATGYNASNVGIGVVPPAGAGYLHFIEDGSPASATCGQLLNTPVLYAAAQPAGGTFVQGHLVRNETPAVSGGKITLGWLRLTTGSGNVGGTDWTPIVATSS